MPGVHWQTIVAGPSRWSSSGLLWRRCCGHLDAEPAVIGPYQGVQEPEVARGSPDDAAHIQGSIRDLPQVQAVLQRQLLHPDHQQAAQCGQPACQESILQNCFWLN